MVLRKAYDGLGDQVSLSTGLVSDVETRTKQEFKDETDINTILRRFNVTGQLPSGVRMPVYGDFSDAFDFQSAANAIAEAKESFDQMPAHVRKRFNNDPGEFVDFCSDPKNLEEAKSLGLVVAPPKAPEAPVVDAGGASVPPVGASLSGASAPVVAAPAAVRTVPT